MKTKPLHYSRITQISVVCVLPWLLGVPLYFKQRQRIATHELQWALGRDDYQAVRKWVAQAGDVNVKPLKASQPGEFELILEDGSPYYGNTPLTIAVKHDDIETIRLLLQKGADAKQEIAGWSVPIAPLMIAIEHSNAEAVELLLTHGASPNIGDWHGRSGLEIAEGIAKSSYTDWRMGGFANHKKASPSQMMSRKRVVWLLKQAGAFARQKY